jgi:hypothetical protein
MQLPAIPSRSSALAALAVCAAALLASSARADERQAPLTLPAKVQQECTACHIAYPPGLLPAASWQRLMANLPRHFGTDASLDAASTQEITAWLLQHAGTSKRVKREPAPPPQDRISRADWFVSKHREVAASTWALPAVKSAANCAACHPGAEQGDFSERNIRIPR